jgi:class 3 adenylate cyclase
VIQRELAERNAGLPYNRKMEFRIGINVGDVVQEEERIYGDGVNLAARVESLSEAGGIGISGSVYDQTDSIARRKRFANFKWINQSQGKQSSHV